MLSADFMGFAWFLKFTVYSKSIWNRLFLLQAQKWMTVTSVTIEIKVQITEKQGSLIADQQEDLRNRGCQELHPTLCKRWAFGKKATLWGPNFGESLSYFACFSLFLLWATLPPLSYQPWSHCSNASQVGHIRIQGNKGKGKEEKRNPIIPHLAPVVVLLSVSLTHNL